MATRKAEARWEGSLQEGKGSMKMATGAYEGPFTFKSRFEEGEGTNPEELIASAHAGCFSMQLSGVLGKEGHEPEYVDTTASVHLRMGEGGAQIARIDLVSRAKVPGIEDDAFQQAAQTAKEICPVSKALGAVPEITLDATLES